ncbi:hypothetical protein Pmani_012007 [Petrolisthes manimaculis]|uniref:Uncharacterized protein n=1 Tax=Petrolisthes manimaculis TaxID=1843537 RepID=A0AAE1PYA0_9EUCA|nr:hypothetical protein Pmani_012007 [Petrolisthes manimaculis]
MISNTSPPFITATILSLQWPPFSSDEAVCKEPQNDYCIDVEGIIRCDGCVWYYESPCQRCQCENGIIKCDNVQCPPAPIGYCVPVPGPCCPTWDCTQQNHLYGRSHFIGCVDKLGHQHDLGEIWADSGNPCFNLTCTTAGIIESDHLPCPPLTHPPHTACILEEEDCCNIWKCPSCVDEDEAERDVGEVWQHPTNTCLVLECTTAGIMEKWITCPSPPPQPSPQCVLVMGEECCPMWMCSLVCPEVDLNINCVQIFNQCFKDTDCPNDSMCCPGACGLVCAQDAIHTSLMTNVSVMVSVGQKDSAALWPTVARSV